MTGYVLPQPPQASVAVHGRSERFAVRRIFCVGRNYADHAREMGHDPDAEPPFYFTKPADAVVDSGATLPYPPQTADLHYEGELVVAIGRAGRDIAPEAALDHVWGYGTGNDLTRRDLQAEAKAARRPWDMAKGFDASAVIGPLVAGNAPPVGRLCTLLDGREVQSSDLAAMIWPVPALIAHLSALVALAPGDLILTGTPAGIGPIQPGQTVRVEITGLPAATVTIAAPGPILPR